MREAKPADGQAPVTTDITARRSRKVSLVTGTVLAGLGVLLAAASVPLYALTHQNALVNGGENIATAVLFVAVGFIIIRSQPRNPIGWILLVAPTGSQLLPADAQSYALLAYRHGHRLPFGATALLLEYSWAVVAFLLLLVILLFPGRPPPVAALAPGAVVLSRPSCVPRGKHLRGCGYRPRRAPRPRRLGRGSRGC